LNVLLENRNEDGINAQLRTMLRIHRSMSIERRIKAVFCWYYMHSPSPLLCKEILKVMLTNKSIFDIYNRMTKNSRLEKPIPHVEMPLFEVIYIIMIVLLAIHGIKIATRFVL